MEALDIIEALNQFHEETEASGYFALHTVIIPESIKAYKKHIFVLWFIDGDRREKVLSTATIARVVTDKEAEKAVYQANMALVKEVFKFMSGDDYKKLIYGVQQVPVNS